MRQFRLFSTLLLALFAFSIFPHALPAQAESPWVCRHAPGSDLYRPDGLVIRYEARNERLLLVSVESGEIVRALETALASLDIGNFDWSPNCRYLFGSANGDAILWDTATGGRVATFANVTPKNPPYWNPERDNLILEVRGGSFLWNFTQSAPLLLDFEGEVCPLTLYRFSGWQVEWDNTRNQVLVVPNYVNGNAVIAYDQMSAQQITTFDNDCLGGPLRFTITPDNRRVIVFTDESNTYSQVDKGLTIWDRETLEHVSVDASTQSAVLPAQVALSPDGRYLVLARIGRMRVWDLATLAGALPDRDPIHRYRIEPNTWSVRFVGDTVVETSDFNGKTARWDILTGERAD